MRMKTLSASVVAVLLFVGLPVSCVDAAPLGALPLTVDAQLVPDAPIILFKGNTRSLALSIEDNGVAVDLTGASLIVTFSRDPFRDNVTTGAVVITDAVAGEATATFSAAQLSQEPGAYIYEVLHLDGAGAPVTVGQGNLKLNGSPVSGDPFVAQQGTNFNWDTFTFYLGDWPFFIIEGTQNVVLGTTTGLVITVRTNFNDGNGTTNLPALSVTNITRVDSNEFGLVRTDGHNIILIDQTNRPTLFGTNTIGVPGILSVLFGSNLTTDISGNTLTVSGLPPGTGGGGTLTNVDLTLVLSNFFQFVQTAAGDWILVMQTNTPHTVDTVGITNRYASWAAEAQPIFEPSNLALVVKTNANGSALFLAMSDTLTDEWSGPLAWEVSRGINTNMNLLLTQRGFAAAAGTNQFIYRYRTNGLVAWTHLTGGVHVAVTTIDNLGRFEDSLDINPLPQSVLEIEWRRNEGAADDFTGDYFGRMTVIEWFE